MKKILAIFLLITLAGCSTPSNKNYLEGPPPSISLKEAEKLYPSIFPHSANFKQGDVHGPAVFAKSLDVCLKCHDESKTRDTIPPCFSCHDESTIHRAQYFKAGTKHGPVAIEKNYRGTCVKCHGDDFKGGKSNISCIRSECHSEDSAFPHIPTNMREKGVHGELFFSKNREKCLSCHVQGIGNKKSCYDSDCHDESQVHLGYYFRDKLVHAPYAISKMIKVSKEEKLCQKCHGEDLDGGKSKISCFGMNCHNAEIGFVHDKPNLADGKIHGSLVYAKSVSYCLDCHNEDSATENGYKSCLGSNCHESFEIHSGSEFKAANKHGISALTNSKGKIKACEKCHGENLSGGGSQKTCYKSSCHDKDEGFYHQKDDFKTIESHGQIAKMQRDKGECSQCHASLVKVQQEDETCIKCHAKKQHSIIEYKDNKVHGAAVFKEGLSSCYTCHSPKSEYSCYKTCHDGFKHDYSEIHLAKEFKPALEHGFTAVKKGSTDSCAKCHGKNLKGEEGLDKSCFGSECHNEKDGFFHFKYKTDFALAKVHEPVAKLKTKKNKAVCTQCHSKKVTKQRKDPSCNKCHGFKTMIHSLEEYRDWKVHGKETFARGLSYCIDCHGKEEDRIREARGKNIASCWDQRGNGDGCHHDKNQVHTSEEYKSHEAHGIPAVNLLLKNKNNSIEKKWACERCHGTNLDGGQVPDKSGKSCYGRDCHNKKDGFYHLVTNFSSDKVHDDYAKKRKITGSKECSKCHDVKVKRHKEDKECLKCHAKDGIHPIEEYRDWEKHGEVHGKAMFERGLPNCLRCHSKEEASKRSGGVSCWDKNNQYRCHHSQAEIHLSESFKPEKEHGVLAVKIGIGGKYSGNVFIKGENNFTCDRCHGRNHLGGKSKKTCFADECHAQSDKDVFYHFKADFKKKEVHGPLAKYKKKAMDVCYKCHGETLEGGKAKKSCYETDCHDPKSGFPHNMKNFFKKEKHGNKAFDLGYSACQKCHGVDIAWVTPLMPGMWTVLSPAVAKATKKEIKDSCWKVCHDGYQHYAYQVHPDKEYKSHEQTLKLYFPKIYKDIDAFKKVECYKCHGDNLKGGNAEKTCYRSGCHTEVP